MRKSSLLCVLLFQSTPSVGRATFQVQLLHLQGKISIHALRGEGDEHGFVKLYNKQKISIHALRGEGDNTVTPKKKQQKNFNPRPPWGGRLEQLTTAFSWVLISIHALRGEGDGFNINI